MKEVKDKWNALADSWSKQWIAPMEEWQWDERLSFAQCVDNGLILDLGCGPGRDTGIFNGLGLSCVGLDFSEQMLRLAKENQGQTICADMTMLPFRSGTFNGIWSCSAMKYLMPKAMLASLKEVRRVLRNGGVFWLGLDEGQGENIEDREDMKLSLQLHTEESIRPHLKNLGFKIIEIKRVKTWRPFISFLMKATQEDAINLDTPI